MWKLIATIVATSAVLLWGEAVHWRSNRRQPTAEPRPGTREAIVVLGYENRGEHANLINRFRVRAGIRSGSPGTEVKLVFSGGSVGGRLPEAEIMAHYARETLHHDGEILTESASRSTWENIRNVVPLIADADRIKIVSNSLHAEKGRAYLRRLRPDLAERLVRSEDYRFGELILLKPAMAVLGLGSLRGLRREEPSTARTGSGPPIASDRRGSEARA